MVVREYIKWGKKMNKNKKGFVFVETIIIMAVIIVAMLGLYTTSNRFLIRIKQYKRYDDINDIYKVYVLKNVITKEMGSTSSKFDGKAACDSGGVLNILTDLQSNTNAKKIFGNGSKLELSSVYIVNTYCLNIATTNKTLQNYLKRIDKDNKYIYLVVEYADNNDFNYASIKVGKYANG